MSPTASEITRDQLLADLRKQGLRVTPHQLLRWHDWGLLPQPRREGLGRGKGTVSYYSRFAALQAGTLARVLGTRRSLVEAGWALWALGFPLTSWARGLLLDELAELRGGLVRADRSLRRGKGQLARMAQRQRPPRGLAKMRKAVPAAEMPRVLQMLMAFQLGTLRAPDYTTDDWYTLQDAVLSEYWPTLVNNSKLPGATEVSQGLAELSKEISVPRTAVELKKVPDLRLEQYRNELQWLTELFAVPEERPTAVMSRSDFLSFFRFRHMHPAGERELALWMKALGQAKPPPSALQRWFRGLREQAGNPSSAKHTT